LPALTDRATRMSALRAFGQVGYAHVVRRRRRHSYSAQRNALGLPGHARPSSEGAIDRQHSDCL
ncbi:MAG: hypothetical protein ACE5JX_11965, partial [Acidobacteriota bacterium]